MRGFFYKWERKDMKGEQSRRPTNCKAGSPGRENIEEKNHQTFQEYLFNSLT